MSDEPGTYRTKTGRVLTDADIHALADEAERGYDVERLARRPGRPLMGSAPAVVVPVRLHADLHAAVKAQAHAESTSLSELVRDALRSYLATEPTTTAEVRTASGRVLAEVDVEALAAEAAAGYDVTALRDRPNRRGRAEVVPVRMPPELKEAAERRAEAESTSVSEIVRVALRARVGDDDTDPPPDDGGRQSAPGVQRRRPTEADTCRDYVVPERVDREEIDGEGNVVKGTVVEEPEPIFDPGDPVDDGDAIDPDDLDDEPLAKFYVKDAEVWVTAEATYHLDPSTHRLRLVEYRDFVTETVRSLYPDPTELRSKWATRVGRQDVLDALGAHGIDPAEVIDRTGLVEADPIDVLVHLAWNQPLATRTDSARRVRKEHAEFFDAYQPAAREVLGYLLDKYAEHGISQLDDPGVFQVPPISSLGTPVEIADRFGSADALRAAVSKLGELVYVA